nr:MAG TPA: hypothetical protein [Caudoviricetes sp.]
MPRTSLSTPYLNRQSATMNSVATNSSIIILSIIGLHPPFLTNFFSTRVLGVGF